MLLEGLHIPLTTPFHSDGRLNLPKLAANIARYSRTPAAGLIVLGPSGEPTLLSDDETREVLRAAAESAAPEKVLIAGISRDSVSATLDLANFAAELSYDAVLVAEPSALTPDVGSANLDFEPGLTAHPKQWIIEQTAYFNIVADRSPLPIILLHAPGRRLQLSAIVQSASHPNVLGVFCAGLGRDTQDEVIGSLLRRTAGIKREASVTSVFAPVTARMRRSARSSPALIAASALSSSSSVDVAETTSTLALRTRTKSVGFQVLAARAGNLLDALNSGAVGIAPAFAACAPQACYEVFAAWKDQDQPLAEEKQFRLRQAVALTESFGPGGRKFACDLNGYFGGMPRLPHLPPNGAQRAELEQLMKPLRN
jgi:dihydrodipicolinate synthase/N-acetylneuraminate lyase